MAKGIAILECFDATHPAMTLSEIARRVGTSPAAARRSLITLSTLGYVSQKNKQFHLKPKVMTLGSAFYVSARLDELLQPDLRRIVETFGDASSVGALDGHDVIYLAHHSVQRAHRSMAVVGAHYPAHATSMGRVILAARSTTEIEDYIQNCALNPLTVHTVTDRDALRDILLRVRNDGYATTVDQLDYGITALAVPIRAADGTTIAALNSSGYSGLVTPEKLIAERLPELRATASKIGQEFARHPALQSALRA